MIDNYAKARKTAIAGVTLLLMFTLQPTVFAQETAPPQTTHDGLTLVPDSTVDLAYVDSEADFSTYEKIMILDTYVAFKKNWKPTSAGSRIRISSGDMEKIKADVAEMFHQVFAEKLSGDGGYKIVETAGDDVLLVRAAIIDLVITSPDTTSAGRTRTYASSAGAATIYIELYDSVTGDILARAIDGKAARNVGGYLAYTNRVTNRAEARRMPVPGRNC